MANEACIHEKLSLTEIYSTLRANKYTISCENPLRICVTGYEAEPANCLQQQEIMILRFSQNRQKSKHNETSTRSFPIKVRSSTPSTRQSRTSFQPSSNPLTALFLSNFTPSAMAPKNSIHRISLMRHPNTDNHGSIYSAKPIQSYQTTNLHLQVLGVGGILFSLRITKESQGLVGTNAHFFSMPTRFFH